MATVVKLSDLKRAAEKKYAEYSIDIDDFGNSVTLLPILKLPKHQRDRLDEISKLSDKEDADALDVFHLWASIVAKTQTDANTLIDAMGDDLSYWKQLQDDWSERTQAGEAQPSES